MLDAVLEVVRGSFNTQPPEGGWSRRSSTRQPESVSTHSRPKAAGIFNKKISMKSIVSTHSRPKAAGRVCFSYGRLTHCFNTQPPEGGWDFY